MVALIVLTIVLLCSDGCFDCSDHLGVPRGATLPHRCDPLWRCRRHHKAPEGVCARVCVGVGVGRLVSECVRPRVSIGVFFGTSSSCTGHGICMCVCVWSSDGLKLF